MQHSFVYVVSVDGRAVTRAFWPANTKVFAIWPFKKKSANPQSIIQVVCMR